MILTTKILNKLINSPLIKDIYPMIDNVESKVIWDGDEDHPFYRIKLNFILNDPTINDENLYVKGFDPHYLIDYYLMDLLKMAGINRNTGTIENIFFTVTGPDGEHIYGWG
jgi:hypothetical protein